MPPATSGSITAFFLYDVAKAIDLAAVTGLVSATVPVLMAPKPQTPSYVAFKPPPISIEGRTVGVPDVEDFAVRFRLFDYGVVSVALTRTRSPTKPRTRSRSPATSTLPAFSRSSRPRLGLDDWKDSVREKLKTLDDIYRFAVEQTAMARGELMELTIVLILVLELVLFFLGVMR